MPGIILDLLRSLRDVTISSPQNGEVLKYNGTNWYNSNIAIGDVTNLTSTLVAKADTSTLTAHTSNTNNPHGTTAAQLGLTKGTLWGRNGWVSSSDVAYLLYNAPTNEIVVSGSTPNGILLFNGTTLASTSLSGVPSQSNPNLIGIANNKLFSQNASNLFISDFVSRTTTVTTLITNAVSNMGVAYCSSNDTYYVATTTPSIVPIPGSTLTPGTPITTSVPTNLASIIYVSATDRIWAASSNSSSNIAIINPSTNAVVTTLSQRAARGLAYDSVRNRVIVAANQGIMNEYDPSNLTGTRIAGGALTNATLNTIFQAAGFGASVFLVTYSDQLLFYNSATQTIIGQMPVTSGFSKTSAHGSLPRIFVNGNGHFDTSQATVISLEVVLL